MSSRHWLGLNLREPARGNVSQCAQPALAQFSTRISKDSSHVLRKRQYFGHLHKEIERSVVINDASDRRRQFSNITLGHRGIPKSAQCNAYQIVNVVRSEERRVGKECGMPCRTRWFMYH